MFAKLTAALAIITAITSGALAGTAHRQHHINAPSACGSALEGCAPTPHWRHSLNPASNAAVEERRKPRTLSADPLASPLSSPTNGAADSPACIPAELC
jgi:hypothetical protein